MNICIPKEIKNKEYRVALTPAGVFELVGAGHSVYVEKNAGREAGFKNSDYLAVGATIVDNVDELWSMANLIIKVKEPLKEEYKYFREDLTIFTYLHLAADKELTDALIASKCTAIAYESVQLANGSLPLLAPMSEIAGKMAVQNGVIYLQKSHGGKGVLIDGTNGVSKGHITIVGGGVVGLAALRRAVGLGCSVTILDISLPRLDQIRDIFSGYNVETLYSNKMNLLEMAKKTDLLIGCVLIPGKKAPKLVSEDIVKSMKKGSVIVDVAIDQGGCVETSVPTTHKNPVYKKHGVIHYAVANIPGAVPNTSTQALVNATLPYIVALAKTDLKTVINSSAPLFKGVNVYKGKLVSSDVAESLGYEAHDLSKLI